jgi:hypothetical protein
MTLDVCEMIRILWPKIYWIGLLPYFGVLWFSDAISDQQWDLLIWLWVVYIMGGWKWKYANEPNLSISFHSITVPGLKIDRRYIKSTRIFRELGLDRGRYLVIQLKQVPPMPIRWRIMKFFEEIPKERWGTKEDDYSEPRLYVRLSCWDLPTRELTEALDPKRPFVRSAFNHCAF